ncbi:hypothetical protein [Curtobacterium sp. ISL-83]|nr:hypothetical protein [Curtobacterium sp. ISL-83]
MNSTLFQAQDRAVGATRQAGGYGPNVVDADADQAPVLSGSGR